MVAIYGPELAGETQVARSAPLPVSLSGTSVFFNGQHAPLLFVSPGQINAQVPFGLTAVTELFPQTTGVIMEVRRGDTTLDRQTISLSPRASVILRESPTRESLPLLFHASDLRRVTAEDPSRRGEAITLFAMGMGDLGPSIAAGALPPTPPPGTSRLPCVLFGQGKASGEGLRYLIASPALWAGAAPDRVGIYQVNLEIPAVLSAGSYTLSLTDHRAGDIFQRECRLGYQGETLDSVTIEIH